MRRPGLLALAIALVLAACGGDSDPPTPAAGGGATTTTSAGGTAALELRAEDIAFSASSLSADAGEVTIRFANQDEGIRHNLHVTGDGVDDKTGIEPGPVTQRLTLTLEPGTYAYVCDVHPQQMTGELTVR
ncbi:MAG: cupredoxin domain-containing protein [Acidimicrobiales bacterium]